MASLPKQIGDEVANWINGGQSWVIPFVPSLYKFPMEIETEATAEVKVVVTAISISTQPSTRGAWMKSYIMGAIVFSHVAETDESLALDKIDLLIELSEQIEDRILEKRDRKFGGFSLQSLGIGLERFVAAEDLIFRGIFGSTIQMNFS